MNNLKRVLSLALSGIMLVGMMAVGAGAVNAKDFTDKDEITHTEAVNVMSTLGVLKGKDTGAFDPKTTVTRAEMAKIVCVMLNGGTDPTVGTGGAAKFSDTANHWARGYIEYCANLGIIAGQGDGTFNPDAPVSGAAAAKMLMVALGYDSDISGFVGADWQLNVDAEANKAKLYEEIRGIDTSAGLSRDDTAQMAYNALSARIMERTDHKVLGTGEISYSYEQSKTTTFLNKYFDAYTFVGYLEGNAKTLGITDGSIQVKGDLDTADTSASGYEAKTAIFPSDFDISNVGEEVKVIFRDGKGGTKYQPDKNDTVYGVFNTGATEVLNVTKADVKDNKAAEAKIKIGSTKYSLADEVIVVTNYVGEGDKYEKDDNSGNATNNGEKDKKNSDLTDALKASNGDAVKVVMKDGKVARIYVVETKLGVVTSKNSTKIAISGAGVLTIADHDIADDLKVDDVVNVTTLYKAKATDEGALAIVTKAETVDGTIEGFDYDDTKDEEKNKSITVDGKTYKVMNEAKTLSNAGIDGTPIDDFSKDTIIGEDATLYLVNGYVAAAIQTSESASNYSVVTDVTETGKVGGVFDTLKVQVMNAAGEKTIYTVAKKSEGTGKDGVPQKSDYEPGTLVTYTVNKDGEAVLKKAGEEIKNNALTEGYNKNVKAFNGKVTTKDCVLFATNANGTWKAYKIRDLKDLSIAKGGYLESKDVVVVEDSGKIAAVLVDAQATPKGVTSSAIYGIITATNGTVKPNGEDTAYKKYTVVSAGETLTVYSNQDGLAKKALVYFEPSVDNTYDDGDITVVNKDAKIDGKDVLVGYVDSYDKEDGVITVVSKLETKKVGDTDIFVVADDAESKTLAVSKDTAIYYVDIDTPDCPDSGSIGKFDPVNGYANIIVVVDGDDAVALLVETSNTANIAAVE